jgi:Ni,Fe-hydrogenase I cytochrome b subunit
MKFKRAFLRLLEVSLAAHGLLHFVEVGLALYEEAYITASFAAFGAITMILGAVFLDQSIVHQHHHHHEEA